MPSKPNSVEYLKSRLEGFVFNPSKHWSEYPCMIWDRSLAKGYGRYKSHGKKLVVHRLAYEIVIGPIPEGLQLDHLCRVRACFCPSHLEPVTGKENINRSPLTGPGSLHGRKTHCQRGHPYSPENTQKNNGARVCRECKRIDVKVHSAAYRAYYKLKSLLTFQPST